MKKVLGSLLVATLATVASAGTVLNVPVAGIDELHGQGGIYVGWYKNDNDMKMAVAKTEGVVNLYLFEFGGYGEGAAKVAALADAYSKGSLVLDVGYNKWGVANEDGAIDYQGNLGKISYDMANFAKITNYKVDMGDYDASKYHYLALIYFTDEYQLGTTEDGNPNYVTAALQGGATYEIGTNLNTKKFGSNCSQDPDNSNPAFKYSSNSGGWVVTSGGMPPAIIPEPTSGMMLLIGLAGLALKRKRA